MQTLKKFAQYFKSAALTDKELREAYDKKFIIDYTQGGYLTTANAMQKIANSLSLTAERIYIPGSKTKYITKREAEILLWLRYGKSYEEIALILNIKERAVRAHITRIKNQLGCHTLFQVGEKLTSLDLV